MSGWDDVLNDAGDGGSPKPQSKWDDVLNSTAIHDNATSSPSKNSKQLSGRIEQDNWGTGIQKAADSIVKTTRDAAAHVVHGAAQGFQDLDNAAMNISRGISDQGTPEENKTPSDFTSAVNDAYQQPLQEGAKEHPLLSQLSESAGQSLPQTPAMEVGAGAAMPAAKALGAVGARATQQALSFLPKATGPAGAAILQGLQKMGPQMMQSITQLTTHGAGGVLGANLQSALTNQMKAGNQRKPDIGKVIGDALSETAEMMPAVIATGGAASTLAFAPKLLKSMAGDIKPFQMSKAKMEQKAIEQQHKMRLEEQKMLHDQHLDKAEADWDASMAQNQQEQEFMKSRIKAQNSELTKPYKNPVLNVRAQRLMQNVQEGMPLDDAHEEALRMRLQDENLAEQQAALKRQQQAQQKQQTAARGEESRAAERTNAAQQSSALLNKEHYAKAQQYADEMANQQPQGSVANAREESRAAEQPKKEPLRLGPYKSDIQAELIQAEPVKKNQRDLVPQFSVKGGRHKSPEGGITRESQRPPSAESFAPEEDEGGYSSIDTESAPQGEGNAFLPLEAEKARDDIAKYLTMQGMNGAGAIAWAGDMVKNPEVRGAAYDTIMHAAGVQWDSDIFRQYAPELKGALDKVGSSLSRLADASESLKKTAGKLRFAQMGTAKTDSDILMKGIRGQLTPKELSELPENARRAVNESRKAIDDYAAEVKPVYDWLKEHIGNDVSTQSGLGRLKATLEGHLESIGKLPRSKTSNFEKGAKTFGSGLMKYGFGARAPLAVIHAVEKGVLMTAKEGIGVLGGIKGAYTPGPVRDFVQNFLGNPSGPLSEAFEEVGGKVKGKLGRTISGQYIEAAPNEVATVIGLDKAARELDYPDGKALAKDLIDARQGKGPLAYNSDKITKAMASIQDYVHNLTGTNVTGLRDRNLYQRGGAIAQLGNLFLTMPTVQARNLHLMAKAIAKNPGSVKAWATMGTALGGLYIAAGDKGPIPKDAEPFIRGAAGDPAYYHFMDAVNAGRAATHINELPTIPHLQPSISPLVSASGSSVLDVGREVARQASTGKFDEKQIKALVKGAAIAAGGAFAGMGVGTAEKYVEGVQNAQKGFKTLRVYQHETFGGEKHVADIPMSTDMVKSLSEAYFGIEGKQEQELTYNAQKTMDLRNWVMKNGDDEFKKESLEDEKDLDALTQLHDLNQERDEAIADAKEMGLDSQKIHDKYTALSAKGDLQQRFWRQRATYWQQRADALQNMLKQKKAVPEQKEAKVVT